MNRNVSTASPSQRGLTVVPADCMGLRTPTRAQKRQGSITVIPAAERTGQQQLVDIQTEEDQVQVQIGIE